MRHLFEDYKVQTFNQNHNIGFWRYEKNWQRGKLYLGANDVTHAEAVSYHAHLFPETYSRADKGLKLGYDQLGELVKSVLPPNIRRFADDL